MTVTAHRHIFKEREFALRDCSIGNEINLEIVESPENVLVNLQTKAQQAYQICQQLQH